MPMEKNGHVQQAEVIVCVDTNSPAGGSVVFDEEVRELGLMLTALTSALQLGSLSAYERVGGSIRIRLTTDDAPALACAVARVVDQMSWRERVQIDACGAGRLPRRRYPVARAQASAARS